MMSWNCVRCGTVLDSGESELTCSGCRVTYPIVGGVPALVARPDLFLLAVKKQVLGGWASLALDRSRQSHASLDGLRAERARQAFEARSQNQALIERHCAPILSRAISASHGPAAFLIEARTGWRVERLLPYFYVDWTDNRSYREVSDAVLAAADLCNTRESAAVLGNGAGRLLLDLADRFGRVTGVDLSLPTLLLAQYLLMGGQAEIFLEHANWKGVRLRGSEKRPANVALAAADAMCLPFADRALSFVVSQYLLDIVDDAGGVAREINRVLEPGGIWFNLGPAFRLPSDPPEPRRWAEQDMSAFTSAFGFDLLTKDRRIFEHLSLTNLDPWAIGSMHELVLFTARKVTALQPDPAGIALRGYFTGNEAKLRQIVPRISKGQALSMSVTTIIQDGTTRTVEEITLGKKGDRVVVGPLSRRLIKDLWCALDGVRTAGELLDIVAADSDGAIQKADVFLAIQVLKDRGIIELRVE
jgi:SAM-dependent methyltransferase